MVCMVIDDLDVLFPIWAQQEVEKRKWRVRKGNNSAQLGGQPIMYAVSGYGKNLVFLHRLIYPGIPLIEHIDGDGLNNLRENIRSAVSKRNIGDPMRCIQWQADIGSFNVRVKRPGGKRVCKRFTANKFGGSKKKALVAAQAYRDQLHLGFGML